MFLGNLLFKTVRRESTAFLNDHAFPWTSMYIYCPGNPDYPSNIIIQIETTRKTAAYILFMLCIYQARYLVFYF